VSANSLYEDDIVFNALVEGRQLL